MNWINFGVSILRKGALEYIPARRACDEEEFYNKLILHKDLLAYKTKERFYEIGNPEALEEFKKSGIVI